MVCEESDDMKGRLLTDEEFTIMLATVSQVVGKQAAPLWRHLLRGVVIFGLRLGELLNISWDIPQTIQPRWQTGRMPLLWFPSHRQKNKKAQDISLCPRLEQLLNETDMLDRTGWVFKRVSLLGEHYRGERLCAQRVGRVVSDIGKKAGIIVGDGTTDYLRIPQRRTSADYAGTARACRNHATAGCGTARQNTYVPRRR